MLKIREHHYDLVLTDQVMPGLAGTQLRRRIMKQAPGLPVMILTDVRQDEWKRQYPSEPDCPFLEKPLRRQAFSRILREMGIVQKPITI
jgi:DNA-binding NtrC family response regulator